jgi:hypothetical protein
MTFDSYLHFIDVSCPAIINVAIFTLQKQKYFWSLGGITDQTLHRKKTDSYFLLKAVPV